MGTVFWGSLWALPPAFLVGLSLGLLGGGGSILSVPVLVYLGGLSPSQAILVSLFVVALSSLITWRKYFLKGLCQIETSLIFSASGIFGTYLGVKVSHLVSEKTLLLSFSGLMALVGILMLFKNSPQTQENSLVEPQKNSVLFILFLGGLIGIMTGFLGVGGGFMIVPGLTLLAGMEMKMAVGSSLLIIFLNCLFALVSHFIQGVSLSDFPVALTLIFTFLVTSGALVGEIYSDRFTGPQLKTGFALLVICVGFGMGIEGLINH